MKRLHKIIIVLSCILLICGAGFYIYYTNNISGRTQGGSANLKPNTISDNTGADGSSQVSKTTLEKTLSPGAILKRIIISRNTETSVVDYEGIVPDNLVNKTKDEASEYYKSLDNGMAVTEFGKDKIVVVKYTPYLPNCYVVKLEGNDIVVYRTDGDGIAYRYEEFIPRPCKNKDEKLEKGIEVKTEKEIYNVIGDYD